MLEQFSTTLDKLYSAATSGLAEWTGALSAVEELTGSAGAVVHVVTKARPNGIVTLVGESGANHFPSDHVEAWTRDYAAICPRLAAAPRFLGMPYICDRMIMSERQMDLDPVYDWYRTHGVRYFIGSPLFENDALQVVWSLQRTPKQGHVQAPDARLFELLKPHMARALTLSDQLGTLRSFDRFSSAVLDAMPNAVFALTSDGRLLFANAAACRLLEAGDGIVLGEGRLRTRLDAEQARLDRLIEGALTSSPDSGNSWAVASRAGGGLPYALFVSRLNVPDDDILTRSAQVLVVVHDLGGKRRACVEMVRSLFALTEAEARLATEISGGHSLESAGALLGIKPSTARAHLKSIFRKVGVNRQQDLVRTLISMTSVQVAQ